MMKTDRLKAFPPASSAQWSDKEWIQEELWFVPPGLQQWYHQVRLVFSEGGGPGNAEQNSICWQIPEEEQKKSKAEKRKEKKEAKKASTEEAAAGVEEEEQ